MHWFGEDLYNLYNSFEQEESETVAEIEFLMETVGNVKYKDYILGKTLADEKKGLIKDYIKERIRTGRPIQQIVGKAYFCGELFKVNEYTLIPRPETELIIECLGQYFNKNDYFKMLDIGTGSGCISITAAKMFPEAKITGVDICQQCIDISSKNAENKDLKDNVNFLLSDVFGNISDRYDVIVSNPPYISINDIDTVQKNVLQFEPQNALFAPNDGYYFYEKIISESTEYLYDNAILIFELGINQSKKVSEFFEKNKFSDIRIIKDFNNIDRVISATYH